MLKLPRKIPEGSMMIEVMAATLILVLVMLSSTPAIFTAITTRVQARRVGEAIQLAQAQVDYVRQLLASGNYSCYEGGTNYWTSSHCVYTNTAQTMYLPPDVDAATTPNVTSRISLRTIAAPTTYSSTACIPFCTSSTQAAVVTQSGQVEHFLVQTFRTSGVNLSSFNSSVTAYSSSDFPVAFRMGVRVYSQTAYQYLQGGGALVGSQSGSSIGVSSNENVQSQAPLVVLYVDLVRADFEQSGPAYQKFSTQ